MVFVEKSDYASYGLEQQFASNQSNQEEVYGAVLCQQVRKFTFILATRDCQEVIAQFLGLCVRRLRIFLKSILEPLFGNMFASSVQNEVNLLCHYEWTNNKKQKNR